MLGYTEPQFALAIMTGSEWEPDFDIASPCSPVSLAIIMYLETEFIR